MKDLKVLDIGTGKNRMTDEVSANRVAEHLTEILSHLKKAAGGVADIGADVKALRELLSTNEDVVEIFFQINMILKGFHILVEGEQWEKSVASARHDYGQSVVTFLRLVHNENFNVKPPEPPKVVNIE